MRIPTSVPTVLTALALGLGCGPASAAVVKFIEQGDNVVVQHDGGFDCGIQFTTNGELAHVTACLSVGPGIIGGTYDAYMIEPADAPYPGSVSDRIHLDLFRIASGPQVQITIDFISDPNEDNTDYVPTYPPPNVPVLLENGQLQLLNDYFRDSGGDGLVFPSGLEIWAQSDVSDPPTPVRRTSWPKLKLIYR